MLQANINLNILAQNLSLLKKESRAKLWFVVKANAYGHGMRSVSHFAQSYCDELAVATLDEAIELAEAGIRVPINILGICDGFDYLKNESIFCAMPHIIPTICDECQLKCLNPYIKTINVKVNSGMNRLGADASGLKRIVKTAHANRVKIKSIFTHFYKGNSMPDTQKQFDLFSKTILPYRKSGIKFHACSSAFLGLPQAYGLDAVRCGIAAYGYSPATKPVMEVYTGIAQLHSVAQGAHISYGDFVAPRDMKIATICIGYGDGFRRKLTPYDERFVCINGELCPIVGQICMDMCMVDVSRIKITGAEKVYILCGQITAEDLAKAYKTIPYEVLTSFAGRIKRNYIGKEDYTQEIEGNS